MSESGEFRKDLYYRLSVVPLYIIPIRDRKEDIRDLVFHYLKFYSTDMGVEVPEITNEALNYLLHYDWPGNVRELKNLIQRLLFFFSKEITLENVQSSMLKPVSNFDDSPYAITFNRNEKILPLRDIELELRLKYINFVRSISDSDADAAKKLGVAPPNFHRICKELGIK